MKRNSHYLIVLLILSIILMTAAGIAGRKGVYARYNYKPLKDGPILTLVLRGLSDDISPLEVLGPSFEKKRETATSSGATALQYFTTPSPTATDTGAEGATDDTADVHTDAPDESSATGASASASAEEVPPAGETTTTSVTGELSPAGENPPAGEVSPAGEVAPVENPNPATPPAEATPPPAPSTPPDTAAPSAVGTPADDSYYADALFIGDSRTVGLSQYVPGLDAYATFYCKTSLNIFNALTTPMVPMEDGMQTAETALSRKQFGKIYIAVGINEIGYGTDAFIASYAESIAKIRSLQPNAVIYVQGIMHVSSAKTAENPVFNNAAVNERNGRLAALTNGTDIVYMDINYLLDDANGALNGAYTFDGVHLTADSYALWYQEIKEQTR